MPKFGRLLAAALLLAGSVALAQDSDPAAPAQPGARYDQRRRDQAEDRLRRMSKELNLTEDQKEKLKPILEDEVQQMKTAQADTSLTSQQRRKKMRGIHKTFEPQVQAVLTPEQRDKLKSMKHEARDRHQRHRRGAGGTGNADSNDPQ
jgi:Spy/CpxP family protein refolding chaperone